jgi:amino acid adenylation domain-containing protein/FkbH-like protein
VGGELFVGGDGLARGYWNRPELTAQKFIKNPFDTAGPSFLYRTGDTARWLPDGTIAFLGRVDDQVKVRGFRIEPGEVEAVLGLHGDVDQCVVLAVGENSASRRLVAYVVPREDVSTNARDLRAFLSQRLPDYMVPSLFVTLRALPLTPNGKIDRQALPAPDQVRPDLEKQYVAPRDEVECQLVGIWEKVLGVSPIGVEDKFFDLGGHSLLAVRVIAQIEKVLGKKLRLATLFQALTIDRLAAILREEITENGVTSGTSLVEIQPHGKCAPLYLVHGAGGGMFWGYINLSRGLGPNQPVYAFKSRGLDGRQELSRIEDIAAQYITDLRNKQPHGPYYLGGYCFGGNVAFEMARQLSAENESVALLALMNCAPPNSRYGRIPWTPKWAARFVANLFYWVSYFLQWSPRQRADFFRWKTSLLKRRLAGSLRKSPRPQDLVDARELVDLSAYTEEQRTIWEAHIRGLVNFHPQRYAGHIHLFRSPGHPFWCSFEPDYGWGELAEGGVTTEIVPGAHEKLLEEPCVRIVAARLQKALQEARAVALPVSADAMHQSNRLIPEEEERQLAYWSKQLAGVPELLDLPADRLRPAQGSVAGARYPLTIPHDLSLLTGSGPGQDHRLFVTLLSIWATLLHRYTGSTDIVIGSMAWNRRRLEGKSPAANPENPIALRCDLSGNPSFRELQHRIALMTQEAFEHGALPFANLVDRLYPRQSANYTPIFQTMFIVEEEPLSSASDLAPTPSELELRTSRYDLILRLTSGSRGLNGWLEYSTALFDESRIARMAVHFATLFRAALSHPEEGISRLPLLSRPECRLLLNEWTNTRAPYPIKKDLIELFEDQVLRTPHAEALIWGLTRLTYIQLWSRATEIARQLRCVGVGKESLVGICLERSADMVASILGTLMSGAAYVPVDPAYPAERIGFIMEDARLGVLLTHSRLMNSLPKTGASLLCIDTLGSGLSPSKLTQHTKRRASDPNALAYVIYTSGSTGKPKGVALEHKGAVALVSWASDVFTSEELSGVLASTSICFDLSVFELFVPLSWGGKVILAENALALPALPAAEEVRLVNTVPSALRELLRMKGIPASVRVINLAGEPLTSDLVDQIYAETCVRKVYDLYGPTETTTYSTFTLRQPGKPPTIGRPLANEQVYLLDAQRQLVPIGVPGELYIGGDGLARGYLNRPELTAEKFVPHPFQAGSRLYRTGDVARWRGDGNLEYLGRIDHQVKIRGFRIELGEIESVLKTHGSIRELVVLAREDYPGEKRLVAYIVPEASSEVSIENLRDLVREKLPEYMMPSAFVFLEALPMTPNGKVDRQALLKTEKTASSSGQKFIAPRTALERKVAAVWCEVLHQEQIGVKDNFFDLGGHSLMAIRAISRIREMFKVEPPISSIFAAPTVASFAEALDSGQWTQDKTSMLLLEAVPRTGRLAVSFVQERLWFLDQLEPGGCAYNVPVALRLRGRLNASALQAAIDGVISRHDALRSTFVYSEGTLEQVIQGTLRIPLPVTDLQRIPMEQREGRVAELVSEEARTPFDLAHGPLVRVRLIRLAPTEHALVVVMHHTVSDGWSLALFFHELALLYDAFPDTTIPDLPALPFQYVDFAHWQRQWMRGPVLARELAYWKGALEGAPSNLDLPTDTNSSSQTTGRAACRAIVLGKDLEAALAELGHTDGCTPFMILMAALQITLHRWTQTQDLVVGTVVAGRTRREVENMVGCFMNFLPIRAKVSADETGRDFLAQVRATIVEGQTHQDCPFEKIVEALNPRRRLNQNPLYNVGLLVQNFPSDLFKSRQIGATLLPVSTHAALLDLRFEAMDSPQGLFLTCEYKVELFENETIDELLASYRQILELLANKPSAPLSEFKITSALEQQAQAARAREQKLRLTVAATFTCEPISESLEFWTQELQLPSIIKFAPYNQVFQQLLDPTSLLRTNPSGLNVIMIRLEDWAKSGSGPDKSNLSDENIARTVGEFISAIKPAAAQSSTPYLVCICPPSPVFAGEPGRAELLVRMEEQLRGTLEEAGGVYLLTTTELKHWYPMTDVYDAGSDELGHVPYTPVFFSTLGTAIARKLFTLNRPGHKVIILDCDQTLWSGVCGEDGAKGIKLDRPRLELQKFMRAQRDSGMLLCLCSKNNEEDVLEVFSQRLDMPLRQEHFASFRLNWSAKSENLKSLAQELGLGLDSFIFLDDNPVECAEVEANCPEVLTLQLPENPVLIPRFLEHCWVFDHLKITEEDRRRSDFYHQDLQRETLRRQAPSLSEFLAGLELEVSIEPIAVAQRARVAQLTQRTNQFNLTSRRFTEGQLQQALTRCQGLSVHVRDRFGDYGVVGVILYEVKSKCLKVDSFLLSCRVLGRGVEHRMLAHLGALAREHNADYLDVHFVRTERNKPGLDFLESVGGVFKQALNGGYVFRFPARFAAEVVFHPMVSETEAEGLKTVSIWRVGAGSGSARKFDACRRIALEACDPVVIHEKIQAAQVLRQAASLSYTAPQTDLECRLCRLWENLLHVNKVGLDDNFFALGGHSLLAVRLFAEIEKLTSRKFPLITLFGSPTVRELNKVLSRADSSAVPSLLVPIQPKGSKPPLFLIHGAGGDVLWGYANLAHHLPPDQPLYGIKSRGQIGLEEFGRLEDMARCYLEAVRQHQPRGPYYLGGYCFGGNVAYEMARQLCAQGEPVALVALLDSAPSNRGYERVTWWRPTFPWRFTRNLINWLQDFAGLPGRDRRNFFWRKARWFGRKTLRRLGLRSGPAAVDLEEIIDPSRIPDHELKLWQIHLQALTEHMEQPYSGGVVLLRTRGQPLLCSLEEDFCWRKVAQGGVKIVFVPGSHESVFMEPKVRLLAKELSALLVTAQTQAAAASFPQHSSDEAPP